MRVLTAGPFGVLLEFDSGGETRRCYDVIGRVRDEARTGAGAGAGAGVGSSAGAIVDVVPAECTVLMIATFDAAGQRALREMVDRVKALPPFDAEAVTSTKDAKTIELPVRYDGPDLDEVAALTGMPAAEVVRLHTETEFTVAFTGFAPGFAYLAGLPERLTVPRRSTPRTRVEAGAVGLAGPYSGVYPRTSPGGWQIIGSLAPDAEALWDVRREAPALLLPGMRVRFRAVEVEAEIEVAADAEAESEVARGDQ